MKELFESLSKAHIEWLSKYASNSADAPTRALSSSPLPDDIEYLISAGLLTSRSALGGRTDISISIEGQTALLYHKTMKERTKRDRIRFWIPIIIDTLLSVAAIVISIIALTS